MIKKIMLILCLTGYLFAQQQVDIPWPTLAQTDWPMIKHDPQFTGRSPYKGPQTATVIWTKDMPSGIFSGPVIGENGNLYFGTYFQDLGHQGVSDYFYCYDKNGNYIWDYKLGTSRPPQTGILIDSSNTIYFGSLDTYFYALNPDGTLKWKYETSGAILEGAIPTIDLQGRTYITNGFGELYSFNPDGTLNWNVKYEGGFFRRSPALSPDGNTIYIFGSDSNLFAINLNGSLKWKFSFIGSDKSPVIDSYGNIYFDGPYYFYSINPNGDVRWKYGELYFGTRSMPTIDKNGNFYTMSYDTTCCPYYPSLISLTNDGSFRWQYVFNDLETDDFWQPLICDSEGTVYVGSTWGHYYYAISSDGELKWKLPLYRYEVDNTSAIGEDGTLYLGVHKSSLAYGLEKTLIAIKDTGTVSVNEIDELPKEYNLFQNYPNPLNPTTTINYQLKDAGIVTLKIYDILGKEVAELVNEFKESGGYSVNFDAGNLPSGVYIYSLRINDFVQNHKMTLIK